MCPISKGDQIISSAHYERRGWFSDKLLAIKEASDRLLEISQFETDSITIERSSVDLAYLVREAISVVEHRLAALEEEEVRETPKRYTFTMHLQDHRGTPTRDEPISLDDRNRLREVLDNLLENAIIYSPNGVQLTLWSVL